MPQFKVTLSCPDGPFTAEEVKKILTDHFLMKLKTEGIAYRLSEIKVEEIKYV